MKKTNFVRTKVDKTKVNETKVAKQKLTKQKLTKLNKTKFTKKNNIKISFDSFLPHQFQLGKNKEKYQVNQVKIIIF